MCSPAPKQMGTPLTALGSAGLIALERNLATSRRSTLGMCHSESLYRSSHSGKPFTPSCIAPFAATYMR